MKPAHILLAVMVAVAWGLNFVAIRLGLNDTPPILLAAARFGLAAIPALWMPRPDVPWSRLVATATLLFTLQFALLFAGMAQGMPPGLASVVCQTQALFTAVLAALFLSERPRAQQIFGLLIGIVGMLVLMSQVGLDGVTWPGMLLTLAAALCWAGGNVLLRGTSASAVPLMVWLSVIAAPMLLAVSLVLEGPARDLQALTNMSWMTVAVIFYNGLPVTLFAYAAWGHLMKLYPASTVAPFSLMVPVFGALSANLVFGERFGMDRLIGMALIIVAVATIAIKLPARAAKSA